jgi:hypothetical protein
MRDDDFKLDTTFTESSRKWQKPAAVGAAIVMITIIILSMTTDLASRILPMDDAYLAALVPHASDNAEPLALKTLDHEINEKVLTVRGSVENRTDFSVAGLAAVIQPLDIYGVPLMPVEVPVQPAEVPAHSVGSFETTVTLADRPSGYSVKFRLVDGPLVPHKDERAEAPTPPVITQ